MRKIEITINGKSKEYTVFPLKGKHIREIMENKRPGFEETFTVLKFAGIPAQDIDEMDFRDCLKLQQEINAETFGVEAEEKN